MRYRRLVAAAVTVGYMYSYGVMFQWISGLVLPSLSHTCTLECCMAVFVVHTLPLFGVEVGGRDQLA